MRLGGGANISEIVTWYGKSEHKGSRKQPMPLHSLFPFTETLKYITKKNPITIVTQVKCLQLFLCLCTAKYPGLDLTCICGRQYSPYLLHSTAALYNP